MGGGLFTGFVHQGKLLWGTFFGANAFFVDVSFAMTVVQFSLGPEVVQIFREKLIFA